MPRPKGARNRQRSPEQMAELKQRKEQRRAVRAAGKARSNGNVPGSNAQGLTDDQERALHFIHLDEYEKAQAAVKAAFAKRKTAIARIRAEGGDLDQIKVSIELKTEEGEEKVAGRTRKTVQAMRWAGSGFQMDLFGPNADSEDYERGKTAGLQGLTPGGDVSQDWLTGWHAGQEALAATLELFRAEPKKIAAEELPPPVGIDVEPEPMPETNIDEGADYSEPLGEGVPWMRDEDDLTEGEVDAPSNENVP